MRVKLTIEYIGTGYCGWQSQRNGVSVQDAVEGALSRYFGGAKIRTHAAGRTDVGVHAEGQVVHFDTDKKVNPYKLCLGVNLSLPEDIAVTKAEIVGEDFDARFSARSKTYVYRLYVSPFRKPTSDVDRCQVYRMPDVSKMREAAQLLVGEHDFAAFQKTGSNLKGTVRTLYRLDIAEKDGKIDITVNGNAFLYNMVRILCGTLLAVGDGRLQASDVAEMLRTGKRKTGVRTLPAKGLTLQEVIY